MEDPYKKGSDLDVYKERWGQGYHLLISTQFSLKVTFFFQPKRILIPCPSPWIRHGKES